MADTKITPAEMLNGLVKARQGGTTGAATWQTTGTSNTDTSTTPVFIQVGSTTSPSNNIKAVTFPVSFTQIPLVFALVQAAAGANQVRVYARDITITGFNLGNLDAGTEVTAWMAIGQ